MYQFKETHLVEGLYLGTVGLGCCEVVLQHFLSILHSRVPHPQFQETAAPPTQEERTLGALGQIFISSQILFVLDNNT